MALPFSRKLTLEKKQSTNTRPNARQPKSVGHSAQEEKTLHDVRGSRVSKARQEDKEKRSLLVALPFTTKKYKKKYHSYVKGTKKRGPRGPERTKVPKGFHTNKYGFKFGYTPFPNFAKVPPSKFRDVYVLLRDEQLELGISIDLKDKEAAAAVATAAANATNAAQGPAHADNAITVHGLINVIMSQATNNDNAITAQARLLRDFPCLDGDGKPVGKVPNYHAIRTASLDKLMAALKPAGLQDKRAKYIQQVLNTIRRASKDANRPDCQLDSNPPNATTFVPGSLSLDYLKELEKQEMFDELCKLPSIGAKSAACIMAFCYRLPVFAVDTHVHRLTLLLGWVPKDCKPDDAFAHLDAQIPDELKYGLHQAFWHHGQKCSKCRARSTGKSEELEEAVCSIEAFVTRGPPKERKTPIKTPVQKRKRERRRSEGSGSPTAKVRKVNKTMKSKPMTEEEADAQGFEMQEVEIEIDDGFGVMGSNKTGTKKLRWSKDVVQDDGTVVTVTAEVVAK